MNTTVQYVRFKFIQPYPIRNNLKFSGNSCSKLLKAIHFYFKSTFGMHAYLNCRVYISDLPYLNIFPHLPQYDNIIYTL